MSNEIGERNVILEVSSQREEGDGSFDLSQDFFSELHQTEMRYVRLKHCKKTKQNEAELVELILKLVSNYTDCIDYFGNLAENVVVYYQAKIKDVNKYYEFFRNVSTLTPSNTPTQREIVVEIDTVKELGSIQEQTGAELLPAEQRQTSVKGKEALTQSLMACLHNQDITTHIKQKMKQVEKIHTTITNSLQQQQDFLTRRKHKRKLNKSFASQSFSEHTTFQSEFNRSNEDNIEISQTSEMIEIDLQALDCQIDNADKLKELMQLKRMKRLIQQDNGQQQLDFTFELRVGSPPP